MKKRVFSLIIALAMALSLLPIAALAAEASKTVEVTSAEELANAVNQAGTTPTTIRLTKDIEGFTTDQIVTIKQDQTLLLDMAGHKISVASNFQGRPIKNNGTLTVTGSGTIDSSASTTGGYGAIDNYGVLTIENGTYTGSVDASGASIKNRPSGVLTIDNGTFNGAVTAVYNEGKAYIYNGVFDCRSCSSCNRDSWGYTIQSHQASGAAAPELYFYDGTVIGVQGAFSTSAGYSEIRNGTFETVACTNHPDGSSAFYALYIAGESGTVESHIYGGTFTSVSRVAAYIGNSNDGGLKKEAIAYIHGGSFTSGDDSNAVYVDKALGGLLITGGTFSSDVTAYIPSGMKQEEEGTVVKDTEKANVQVGDAYYKTLPEALAAAQAGDTVELLSNVEVDTWNQVWNLQGITLDGNGYTLTIKNIASGQNHDAVFHSAGGNTFQDLTIDLSGLESASLAQGSRAFSAAAGDTYKNITILGNKNLSYGMTASGTNAEDETITIDGCTFENCGYGIYDDESGAVENLVITNSSFTGCEYATILRGANSSFTDNTVSGGQLNVMQDGQTVTGNTFTDGSRIKFYADGAQFEQNKISQDSCLDFSDSFSGQLDVSHNYWGGGAPTEEQLGKSEKVTGNDVYYIRDTMRDQDLNTYIPPDTTPYYTITVKDADNGTVTCYAKSAAKGADVTLNVKADVGYQLDKLTVTDASGNVIDVEKVNNTTYTCPSPT